MPRKGHPGMKGEKNPMYGTISPFRGKKHTEETRAKIREKSKLYYERHRDDSPVHSKRRSPRPPISEETRIKQRIAKLGDKNPFWGKHLSPENRLLMSEIRLGEKHPLWRGGVSRYPSDWTETLRKSIRQRDNYTCALCHSEGCECHHIDYDKTNNNPQNIITLCCPCHAKTNWNRVAWTLFFQDVMSDLGRGE